MKKLVSLLFVLVCLCVPAGAQKAQVSDYYFKLAEDALENDDLDAALENVNKFIADYPKVADGYMLRGVINYNQEKNGAALTDFTTAIKFWKKDGRFLKGTLYFWRAFVYQALELYDEALNDYETTYKLFLKTNKEQIHDVLYSRAQLYYDLKRYEEADADYRLMLKHNEADQVAMIGLARNMIVREEYAEAVEMTNMCERFDASFSEIYRFRMQAYGGLGEDDKAIDDAITYYETSDDANESAMRQYFEKHLSYALAKVNAKIKTTTDNKGWKFLRTSIYEWDEDWVNAIKCYNELEKEYGSSQVIYYYRSICYSEIGDYEKAIRDITLNIENGEEDDFWALTQRGRYYKESQQYDLAIADYKKASEAFPLIPHGYIHLADCYVLNNDDEKALENYNAAIELEREVPYFFMQRGKLFLRQNEKLLAEADFEEILKRDTVAEEGSCRHYALHFMGRDDEALVWMDKLIELDTLKAGMYYDKACLLSLMGRGDEAIASLKVALEKGYDEFAHIAQDSDVDAIRNRAEFIELINKYSKKVVDVEDIVGENDSIAVISEIEIKKMYSGVYEVPCNINGLPLKFIFDTGASSVSISSVEASFMLKNGYLNKDDIEGTEYFSTATGEIQEGTIIRLREIKIGDAVLRNVKASVVHNQQAPLLLGQSVLERFGTITIDNINSKLIIKQ